MQPVPQDSMPVVQSGSCETVNERIGDYILCESIGKGTFGKVKLGIHSLTQEKVAIKVLEKRMIAGDADIQAVKTEIHILENTLHPNISQLYQIIETDESLYLIMEFAENGELFDFIVRKRRLTSLESCLVFAQLINAVEYLHELGVSHRDLKPENILFSSSFELKIIDFGLSSQGDIQNPPLLNTCCGSPCYASPETISSLPYIGTYVDIWSCGIILFAMACGYLPFDDDDQAELFKKIAACQYTIPSEISEDLADLIKGLIVKDPRNRMTIQEIKQTAFYVNHMKGALLRQGFRIGRDQITIRNEVVNQVCQMLSVSEEEVRKNIEENAHNPITATYYLIVKKNDREQLLQNEEYIPTSEEQRRNQIQIVPDTTSQNELTSPETTKEVSSSSSITNQTEPSPLFTSQIAENSISLLHLPASSNSIVVPPTMSQALTACNSHSQSHSTNNHKCTGTPLSQQLIKSKYFSSNPHEGGTVTDYTELEENGCNKVESNTSLLHNSRIGRSTTIQQQQPKKTSFFQETSDIDQTDQPNFAGGTAISILEIQTNSNSLIQQSQEQSDISKIISSFLLKMQNKNKQQQGFSNYFHLNPKRLSAQFNHQKNLLLTKSLQQSKNTKDNSDFQKQFNTCQTMQDSNNDSDMAISLNSAIKAKSEQVIQVPKSAYASVNHSDNTQNSFDLTNYASMPLLTVPTIKEEVKSIFKPKLEQQEFTPSFTRDFDLKQCLSSPSPFVFSPSINPQSSPSPIVPEQQLKSQPLFQQHLLSSKQQQQQQQQGQFQQSIQVQSVPNSGSNQQLKLQQQQLAQQIPKFEFTGQSRFLQFKNVMEKGKSIACQPTQHKNLVGKGKTSSSQMHQMNNTCLAQSLSPKRSDSLTNQPQQLNNTTKRTNQQKNELKRMIDSFICSPFKNEIKSSSKKSLGIHAMSMGIPCVTTTSSKKIKLPPPILIMADKNASTTTNHDQSLMYHSSNKVSRSSLNPCVLFAQKQESQVTPRNLSGQIATIARQSNSISQIQNPSEIKKSARLCASVIETSLSTQQTYLSTEDLVIEKETLNEADLNSKVNCSDLIKSFISKLKQTSITKQTQSYEQRSSNQKDKCQAINNSTTTNASITKSQSKIRPNSSEGISISTPHSKINFQPSNGLIHSSKLSQETANINLQSRSQINSARSNMSPDTKVNKLVQKQSQSKPLMTESSSTRQQTKGTQRQVQNNNFFISKNPSVLNLSSRANFQKLNLNQLTLFNSLNSKNTQSLAALEPLGQTQIGPFTVRPTIQRNQSPIEPPLQSPPSNPSQISQRSKTDILRNSVSPTNHSIQAIEKSIKLKTEGQQVKRNSQVLIQKQIPKLLMSNCLQASILSSAKNSAKLTSPKSLEKNNNKIKTPVKLFPSSDSSQTK